MDIFWGGHFSDYHTYLQAVLHKPASVWDGNLIMSPLVALSINSKVQQGSSWFGPCLFLQLYHLPQHYHAPSSTVLKKTLFFVVFVGFHFRLFFLTFLCIFCLFGRNMHISFTCLTAISNFSSDIHLFDEALLNHKIQIRHVVCVLLSLSHLLLIA